MSNFVLLYFSWATQSTKFLAKTYQEGSTDIKESCEIEIFERNVQVSGMRSIDAPVFLDIVRRTLPEGVELRYYS